MKDLLLRSYVVMGTANMKTSPCCLADYFKKLHRNACRTCSTIIFPCLTNQIIDVRRCHCSPTIPAMNCHMLFFCSSRYLSDLWFEIEGESYTVGKIRGEIQVGVYILKFLLRSFCHNGTCHQSIRTRQRLRNKSEL